MRDVANGVLGSLLVFLDNVAVNWQRFIFIILFAALPDP
jgi:hypothetical protein